MLHNRCQGRSYFKANKKKPDDCVEINENDKDDQRTVHAVYRTMWDEMNFNSGRNIVHTWINGWKVEQWLTQTREWDLFVLSIWVMMSSMTVMLLNIPLRLNGHCWQYLGWGLFLCVFEGMSAGNGSMFSMVMKSLLLQMFSAVFDCSVFCTFEVSVPLVLHWVAAVLWIMA